MLFRAWNDGRQPRSVRGALLGDLQHHNKLHTLSPGLPRNRGQSVRVGELVPLIRDPARKRSRQDRCRQGIADRWGGAARHPHRIRFPRPSRSRIYTLLLFDPVVCNDLIK
jgi:hypothetical protein